MIIGQRNNIDSWNRIEIPGISPCIYSQITLNKGVKKTHAGRNGSGKTSIQIQEIENLTPSSQPAQK
jgi:hypothetical protein